MTPLLHALDVDVQIEHGGHHLRLTGSRMRFNATFPTLLSILHFAPIFWRLRTHLTFEAYVRVEWRGLGFAIKAGG